MVAAIQPIAVLPADSSDIARGGLRELLHRDRRFRLVGETAASPAALAHQLQPDLVLLDPARGRNLDLRVIDELHKAAPGSPVVIRTDAFQPRSFMAAMLKRVHGYFPKEAAPDGRRLLDALVPIAHSGVVSVGPTIAEHFWSLPGTPIEVHEPDEAAGRLTERQREILALLAQGLDDQQIARRLHIDVRTVETHVAQARDRLGATHRSTSPAWQRITASSDAPRRRGAMLVWAQTSPPLVPLVRDTSPRQPAGAPAPVGTADNAAQLQALLSQIPLAAPSKDNPTQVTRQVQVDEHGVTSSVVMIPKGNPQYASLSAKIKSLAPASADCPTPDTALLNRAVTQLMDAAPSAARFVSQSGPPYGSYWGSAPLECASGDAAYVVVDVDPGYGTGQFVLFESGEYWDDNIFGYCPASGGCQALFSVNTDYYPYESVDWFNLYWTDPAAIYIYWCSPPE